jgi:uncharacterized protein
MATGKLSAKSAPPLHPWRAVSDGVRLTVRLTPKASADVVGNVVTGPDVPHLPVPHLAVKVRALPAEGAANAALEKLIAKWLGLAQRDVALAGGGKSRLKTLHLCGDPAELCERLAEKLALAKRKP